jgi:tetratricopeptide (TPR) repeat protein
MGEIFESLGRLQEAQREYQAAHQVLEKQLLENPSDVQLKWNVSRAASRLGGAMLLLGDRDAARRYSQQCLDLRRDVASAYPNRQVRTNLATAYAKLGDVLRDMGLTRDARANYRQALDIQQELALDASDEERAAMKGEVRATFDRLGELHLLWLNEPQTAQEHYDQSLQIAESIRDASPKSFAARLNLATALVKRGNVSRRLNNPDADDYFRKALDLLEVLAQEEDPEILMVQGELALVLARLGQHERAAERAEKLRQLSPEYSRNLYNVACCYALCAAAVSDSTPVPSTADAESIRNEYVAKAIDALRQCLKHGLDRSTYLEIDPDLDAIRQAPEFQDIVRELKALHPAAALEQSQGVRSTAG